MTQRFLLDTSFLINGWHKRYRIDVFPSLWDAIGGLMDEGVVLSCEQVYQELQGQRDTLSEWAKKRRSVFKEPTEEVIAELSTIMTRFTNFAAKGGGSNNRADPWVIAHAIVNGAIVVTDEQPAKRQKPTKPPKIPNVCDELEILWATPIDFLAKAGIYF